MDISFSDIEMPEMIEKMTIDLAIASTLPIDLDAKFYMYDSEQGVVTDTLVGESKLIEASFDGQPTYSTVSIDITNERIQNVLHSDRIIMSYLLDTNAQQVHIKADQKLGLFVKGKAKYDGTLEIVK